MVDRQQFGIHLIKEVDFLAWFLYRYSNIHSTFPRNSWTNYKESLKCVTLFELTAKQNKIYKNIYVPDKLILLNNFVHFDGLENLQGLEWLNVFVLLTVTQNLTNMIYFSDCWNLFLQSQKIFYLFIESRYFIKIFI